MDNEPQPLTADELKRFYEYLREKKIFCKEKTPFKRKARFWQREQGKGLIIPNIKEVLLKETSAKEGKNFYMDNFGIFDAVQKRYPNFSEQLYQDMLSSKHIPFNMFTPLDQNRDYFINIFNDLLGKNIKEDKKIKEIEVFKIEHKPEPEENYGYLEDNTSFDVYIEYISKGNERCIIGIEIKYTETSYSIGEEEKKKVDCLDSIYYDVTRRSKAYTDICVSKDSELKENKYRQIWRNHILGESIRLSPLQKDKEKKFKDFISITIYPKENEHFEKVSEKYVDFLKKEYQYKCLFFTYEELFKLFKYHRQKIQDKKKQYKKWIKWMELRYIVNDDKIRKICQIK